MLQHEKKSAGKGQKFQRHSMHKFRRGPYSHVKMLSLQLKPPISVSAILASGELKTEVPSESFK